MRLLNQSLSSPVLPLPDPETLEGYSDSVLTLSMPSMAWALQ